MRLLTVRKSLMRQFLKQLLHRFVGLGSEDKLPDLVHADELLTRFIYSSTDFAITKRVVKPRAFLPESNGETSVFRISNVSNEAIWAIGNSIRTVRSKARGDITCALPKNLGLKVKSAPEKDNPRHAVIEGWPEHANDKLRKDERLMLATLLSKEAVLCTPPTDFT